MSELMHDDFPAPVAPEMRMWGISARLAMTARPAMSRPRATSRGWVALRASSEASTSPRVTSWRRAVGDLDADGRLPGDGGQDADVGRGHGVGDVLGQAGHPGHLHARARARARSGSRWARRCGPPAGWPRRGRRGRSTRARPGALDLGVVELLRLRPATAASRGGSRHSPLVADAGSTARVGVGAPAGGGRRAARSRSRERCRGPGSGSGVGLDDLGLGPSTAGSGASSSSRSNSTGAATRRPRLGGGGSLGLESSSPARPRLGVLRRPAGTSGLPQLGARRPWPPPSAARRVTPVNRTSGQHDDGDEDDRGPPATEARAQGLPTAAPTIRRRRPGGATRPSGGGHRRRCRPGPPPTTTPSTRPTRPARPCSCSERPDDEA